MHNINLTKQELNDLLAILESAPYKKVKHLIQKLEEQTGRSSSEDDEDQALEIGERVRARWLKGNTWYTGTINKFKNGKYFIKYDDGDEEWTTREFIESLQKPGSRGDLKVGDRVKVRWQQGDVWYNGTIGQINGAQYFINYDDGDEEWTTREFMEKI